MAILSSSTLIRLHGLTLLLVALLFLFSPDYIPSSTLVWSLGEALQLPDPTSSAPAPYKGTLSSPPSPSGSPPAPMTAFVLIILALFHLFFAPGAILPPSKYNVVTFSTAQGLVRTWQTLSGVVGGVCLLGGAGIYLLTATSDEQGAAGVLGEIARVLADRTLFATCFVDFLFWYYVYSVLREEMIELAAVGMERGEDWGLLGPRDDKDRLD